MPFGQSLLLGMFAGNAAKRLTILTGGALGMGRRECEKLSDQVGVVTTEAIGTATAICTLDLPGAALLAGYAGLLENEIARKTAITAGTQSDKPST